MKQPLASPEPAISAHSYENGILDEHERFLEEIPPAAVTPVAVVASGPSGVKRYVPLILLAVVGAAFALAQVDVKETLLTGRSVAHPSSR